MARGRSSWVWPAPRKATGNEQGMEVTALGKGEDESLQSQFSASTTSGFVFTSGKYNSSKQLKPSLKLNLNKEAQIFHFHSETQSEVIKQGPHMPRHVLLPCFCSFALTRELIVFTDSEFFFTHQDVVMSEKFQLC
jgi:hypothetical protein